ncbi:MAG: DciA family protein [Acidiferrobacterales bacterium]
MSRSSPDNTSAATLARRIGSFFSQETLRQLGMPQDLKLLPQICAAWTLAVGEPVCRHVQPTRYTRGQLSLCADSSAWASRIRHQQQGLIERLRHNPSFRQLAALEVRILPPGEGRRRGPPPVAPNRLSSSNIRLLEQVAGDIADPGLRAALERLGRNRS